MAKTTALQAWNIAANEWQTIDTEAGASDVTDWELADWGDGIYRTVTTDDDETGEETISDEHTTGPVYADAAEAIVRGIIPALGEYAARYHLDGIFADTFAWTDDPRGRGFTCTADPERFAEVIQRYAAPLQLRWDEYREFPGDSAGQIEGGFDLYLEAPAFDLDDPQREDWVPVSNRSRHTACLPFRDADFLAAGPDDDVDVTETEPWAEVEDRLLAANHLTRDDIAGVYGPW